MKTRLFFSLLLLGACVTQLTAASRIGFYGVTPLLPTLQVPDFTPNGGLAGSDVTLSSGGVDALFFWSTNSWATTNMGSMVTNMCVGQIRAYAQREGYITSGIGTSANYTNLPSGNCDVEGIGQAYGAGLEGNFQIGYDTQYYSGGEVFVPSATATYCAVACVVSTVGSNPEQITSKTFAAQIETSSGTVLATTADFAGVQAWSLTRITNALTSSVTLNAGTTYRMRLVPKGGSLGMPFLYLIAHTSGSLVEAHAVGWESNGTTTYADQPTWDVCFGLLKQ